MKILIVSAILIFSSCANNSNKSKENETPVVTSPSAVTSDSDHVDTMMQPNGVSNGTVILDTLKK